MTTPNTTRRWPWFAFALVTAACWTAIGAWWWQNIPSIPLDMDAQDPALQALHTSAVMAHNVTALGLGIAAAVGVMLLAWLIGKFGKQRR